MTIPIRFRAASAFVLAALAGCSGVARPAGPAPATPYDILIRGGRIVDGTGSPWYRGDVAIRGDRIAAVGLLAGAVARDTIDATGLVVAPGFIDMLGHSEYPLLRDGRAVSKITQGVTTEVTGEVTSVVPVNENTLRELSAEARSRRHLDRPGRLLRGAGARPARHQPGHLRHRGVGAALRDRRRGPPRDARRGGADEGLVAGAMQQGAMGSPAASSTPPRRTPAPRR
jgi:hypothetical protein